MTFVLLKICFCLTSILQYQKPSAIIMALNNKETSRMLNLIDMLSNKRYMRTTKQHGLRFCKRIKNLTI